jgi:hypothetical protein
MKLNKVQILYGSLPKTDNSISISKENLELGFFNHFRKIESTRKEFLNELDRIISKKMDFCHKKEYEYMANHRDKEWATLTKEFALDRETAKYGGYLIDDCLIYVFILRENTDSAKG